MCNLPPFLGAYNSISGRGLREELSCCVDIESSIQSCKVERNLSHVVATSVDSPDNT